MYYNKKQANEIEKSQQNYIKSSPYYRQDDFVSNQHKRFANRRSFGHHPFPSGNERTYYQEPLIVGSKHFKNFEDYNNRSNDKSNLKSRGGSMLLNKPLLGGGYSSDDASSDDASSDYSVVPSDDASSDEEEGAGFYDDVIVPVGRTIGNAGKEILKDVVLPIGKELLKDALKGAIVGAGHKKIKNKDFENILKKSKKCDESMNDISNILKNSKIHSKKNIKTDIKPIVGTKRGESVRGDVVAEYMKKHNVKLGEASKKVKELGLY